MKCINCGQENKVIARFCKKCGRDMTIPPVWFPDWKWHLRALVIIYIFLIAAFFAGKANNILKNSSQIINYIGRIGRKTWPWAVGTSYRLGGGCRWPPYLERRSGMFVAVKGGIGTKDRVYIRTKSGDFLNKDFIFEVVFEGPQDHDTAFFGLGEARPGRESGEPVGSVNLRIHGPGKRKGAVTLTKAGPFAGKTMGYIPRPGTHRARIHKKGPTVTFSIDVNDDGPSSNDFSKKIPDIKAFATFLNDNNFHLFFGSGAKVTYKEVRLVLLN